MTLDELSISKLWYFDPEWLTTGKEPPNWTDLSDMPEECVTTLVSATKCIITGKTKDTIVQHAYT